MAASGNWFDLVVILALIYGMWSGIRAGLSGEIIGLVGFVLMVVVAAQFCQPVGECLCNWLSLGDNWAGLLGFVVIAGVIYVLTVVVRRAVHARFSKMSFAAVVENVGGGAAGIVRMLVVMSLASIIASFTHYEWLHKNIVQDSRFGAAVVQHFPSVRAMVETNFHGNVWFMNDLKRREEPTPDVTETNKAGK